MKIFILNRKRILSVALALIIAFGSFGVVSFSAFAVTNDTAAVSAAAVGTEFNITSNSINIKFSVTGEDTVKAVEITNYPSSYFDVVIPETVKYAGVTYTVTEVGADIFNNILITSVDMPATVEKAEFNEPYKFIHAELEEIKIRSLTNPFDEESSKTIQSSATAVRVHMGSEVEQEFKKKYSIVYVRYFELSGPQSGQTFTVDGVIYYVTSRDAETAEVFAYSWESGLTELTIHGSVECEGIVFDVGSLAFQVSNTKSSLKKEITKITFEDGVQSISLGAFSGFANLTEIYIYDKDTLVYQLGSVDLDVSQLTIYAYTGSKAETFAINQGINFVALDEPATTEPETTIPETTVPVTTEPVTTIPETTVPVTTEPETTIPETTVPETTEPETTIPETTVPLTTASETTVPLTTVPLGYILGDADGDNEVKIDDATTIQRYIAELIDLSETNRLAADVNGDENIDIEDVTLIQMWLAGFDSAMGYGIGE